MKKCSTMCHHSLMIQMELRGGSSTGQKHRFSDRTLELACVVAHHWDSAVSRVWQVQHHFGGGRWGRSWWYVAVQITAEHKSLVSF